MSSTPNKEPELSLEEQQKNVDDFTEKVTQRILKEAGCCDEHDAEMKILMPAIGEMCKSLLGKVSPMTMAKGLLLYGRHLGGSILKDVLPQLLSGAVDPDTAQRLTGVPDLKVFGGRHIEEAVVDDISVSSGSPKRTLH